MQALNTNPASGNRRSVTIGNGESLSGAIELQQSRPRGLDVLVPAVWTAADIGFQVSNDGVTYYPLYDAAGDRVKIAGIATSEAGLYGGPAELWSLGTWQYLKLESIDTSSGAAVTQDAERALTVVLLA